MPNQAIQKVIDRAQGYRASLARYREKARISEERTFGAVTALAGAAAAGYADAKLGEGAENVKVLGLPAMPLVGLGLVALGLSDWVPGGTYICQAGVGVASYALGSYVRGKAEES